MIDFPASPTDGQIFSATNGVVYKYSAAYSSWLAQNAAPPLGGTGQVTASAASFAMDNSIADRIAFATVIAGNAGLWWNVSTSRYTPPAGSYFLSCNCSVQAPAAGNGTVSLYLRKNGAQVGNGITGSGSPQFAVPLTLGEYVDANGTDYFEWWVLGQAANMTMLGGMFSAFPLTGMQGPTGGAPGPVVGDFCAISSTTFNLTGTAALVIVPSPAIVGNSGGYYNAATGRYTPPAGRYCLTLTGSPYNSGGTSGSANLQIRKNGVIINQANSTTASGAQIGMSVEATVDANGTDYFEIWGLTGASVGQLSYLTFMSFPTQGMVGPQGPMGPAGVTQTVFFETGAVATGTTIIPADDTIPQITEGDQYMSLSITPQSATSKLIIDVVWNGTTNSGPCQMVAALFQDATANALAATFQAAPATGYALNLKFSHTMTSGTTSPTTFRVRAGPNVGSTTVTFNGIAAARIFGGVMASSIVIREVP